MSTKTFKKRSRMAIYSEILSLCNEKPEIKTHIMYKSNLSYDQLKNYILLLLELGFLCMQSSSDKKNKTLKSTSKGVKFLRKYAEIQAIMNLDVTRV